MQIMMVVGAQGGDEGKRKIVDYLASDYDVLIRFQGGNNAAHTVMVEQKPYTLHLVPSGIFRDHTIAFLGNGMVVSPDALKKELDELTEYGVDVSRIYISEKAHILFPHHVLIDNLSDKANGVIDTTRCGIGPAYMDKASREGIRFEDLKHPELLREKLKKILPRINTILKMYDCPPRDFEEEFQRCEEWSRWILPMLKEPVSFMQECLKENKKMLFEGQLGVLRDLDLGTYPYVTSSSPTAAYACAVSGIPIKKVTDIVGVVRAYPILAGNGPFPTEMEESVASVLRGTGEKPDDEYGGTTGRARRIGWLDLPALRYSAGINGYTKIALCKLDKLDDFSEIRVCTHYILDGDRIDYMPDTVELARVRPCYITVPGWEESTRHIRFISDLPKNAQNYIKLIEEAVQAPVVCVGVGPDRDEIAV